MEKVLHFQTPRNILGCVKLRESVGILCFRSDVKSIYVGVKKVRMIHGDFKFIVSKSLVEHIIKKAVEPTDEFEIVYLLRRLGNFDCKFID